MRTINTGGVCAMLVEQDVKPLGFGNPVISLFKKFSNSLNN